MHTCLLLHSQEVWFHSGLAGLARTKHRPDLQARAVAGIMDS